MKFIIKEKCVLSVNNIQAFYSQSILKVVWKTTLMRWRWYEKWKMFSRFHLISSSDRGAFTLLFFVKTNCSHDQYSFINSKLFMFNWILLVKCQVFHERLIILVKNSIYHNRLICSVKFILTDMHFECVFARWVS